MDRCRPRFVRLRSLAALVAAVSLAASPGFAKISAQIVNGVQELAEPSTGALVYGDVDTGYLACSAVLVGCDVAVTTAHCFNQNPQLKTHLYFQHAGFYEIESATRHPAYADALATFPPNLFDILRVEDIAFIKLAVPVSGITPSTLVSVQAPPVGTPGRIVGFGRDPITQTSAATADQNVGIKRSGDMELATCEGSLAGWDILCWDPPAPQGDPGEDASTCDGDSGGPLFVDESGSRVVAGLTKGRVFDSQGQSDLCVPPVNPYDTSVFRHLDWIQGSDGTGGMVSQTGAMPFANKTCSSLPQLAETAQSGDAFGSCVGDAWNASESVRSCGFTGFLDDISPTSAQHQFDVPAGTTLLRVAFNGISTTAATVDTNFYLRAGAPATTGQYDCAAAASGNLGFCELSDPAAVTWHVLVDQVLYQGEYQVTVSLFGPPPDGVDVPAIAAAARVLLAGLVAASPWLLAWRRRGGAAGLRRR